MIFPTFALLFAKIASLFRKLKSAICLFPLNFAELFDSAFLLDLLEIADFIFDRSPLRIITICLICRLCVGCAVGANGALPHTLQGGSSPP
jgi:hypothetical protein